MSKLEFNTKSKYKYFVAVLYPESMVDDWEDNISYILQKPYAYCIHDKDKDGHDGDRKVHVHVMVAYGGNTTLKSALSLFKRLQPSCNYCEPCDVNYMYNYLIHDTDDCKKKGKYIYDVSERVLGNNFDIGDYEQVSLKYKKDLAWEFGFIIRRNRISTFDDFLDLLDRDYDVDNTVKDVVMVYSGFLERICRGVYLKDSQKCKK